MVLLPCYSDMKESPLKGKSCVYRICSFSTIYTHTYTYMDTHIIFTYIYVWGIDNPYSIKPEARRIFILIAKKVRLSWKEVLSCTANTVCSSVLSLVGSLRFLLAGESRDKSQSLFLTGFFLITLSKWSHIFLNAP
jgi:hypothetical protein